MSFDGSGNKYVSFRGEGESCALVGIAPVVAIAGDNEFSEGVGQYFMKCCSVLYARFWKVAELPLYLLNMIPTIVVGGFVQLSGCSSKLNRGFIVLIIYAA